MITLGLKHLVDLSAHDEQINFGQMATLRDDGIEKVLEGVTTLEEVLRVTQG